MSLDRVVAQQHSTICFCVCLCKLQHIWHIAVCIPVCVFIDLMFIMNICLSIYVPCAFSLVAFQFSYFPLFPNKARLLSKCSSSGYNTVCRLCVKHRLSSLCRNSFSNSLHMMLNCSSKGRIFILWVDRMNQMEHFYCCLSP